MLDPEIIYTVVVNVFDGNEMVLRNQTYMRPVLVQGGNVCTVHIYVPVNECTYTLGWVL